MNCPIPLLNPKVLQPEGRAPVPVVHAPHGGKAELRRQPQQLFLELPSEIFSPILT